MTKTNIEPSQFYFQVPAYNPALSKPANVTYQMGSLASRLVQELRTRTYHPDGRLENVAEHSLMLAKIAPEIAAEMHSELDRGLIALYATVHDDVEAYVQDTATDRIDANGRAEKARREAEGLSQLLKEFSHMPAYCKTIQEYEAQKIPEARFVRVVDKLTVVLIHIPNSGRVITDEYGRDEFLAITRDMVARLHDEYPEFRDVIDLRTELAHYLADLYLPSSDTIS